MRKQMAACLKELTVESARLEKSPLSQQAAGAELTIAMHTAFGEATDLQELFTLVCSGGKISDHSYVQALDLCTSKGVHFPAAFHFKKCAASVGQALSVDDLAKVVQTG